MTLTLATLTILLVPAVVIVGVYVLLCRQISAARRRLSTPTDCTAELSMDRYRPMLRLLEDDDIRFLRSQPGATPALVKRLRRQRNQVFRGYLRSLNRDFHGASEALMLLALRSQTDRRDVMRALLVGRITFSLGVFRVRCRLFLYRWNIGQAPVAHLVSLFEGLQLELLALMPVGAEA